MDHVYERFGGRYEKDPRILAVGPAAAATDFGGICSVPITKGKLTYVDTWAGRGGFGTKMLREHGIAAVIYGGTHLEEDFKDGIADLFTAPTVGSWQVNGRRYEGVPFSGRTRP